MSVASSTVVAGSPAAAVAEAVRHHRCVMVDELIENYPHLYHMAWEGSWPLIRAEGLLTTRQLVDACDPDHDLRDAVLARPRPLSVMLHHPTRGAVTIRDQAPLRENVLIEKLTDMSIPEWLDVLNGRVFFWLHPDKLSKLLGATRYRKKAHDVTTYSLSRLRACCAIIASASGCRPSTRVPPCTRTHLSGAPAHFFACTNTPGPTAAAVVWLTRSRSSQWSTGYPTSRTTSCGVERRREGELLEVLYEHDDPTLPDPA